MRTTNAKTVAEALIQYFSRVGIPDEIVSDQGSNFMSKLLAQLYDQLGVTKIKTSVYHPEANGLVERFNGTLKGTGKFPWRPLLSKSPHLLPRKDYMSF